MASWISEMTAGSPDTVAVTAFEGDDPLADDAPPDRFRRLLRRSDMRMVFQPIRDLHTGEVMGAEALARFPGEPSRPPHAWFEEASKLGLGIDLQLAALRAAFRRLPELPAGIYLAVNLGPATLWSGLLELALAHAPPERVVLELTEHDRIDDYVLAMRSLSPLRARGVRLAIDDAGAGFSSLRHIAKLQPDIIKLDLSLTRDVDVDPVRQALTSSLASLARKLGAASVAEGIETEAELDALRRLGVDWGQGYLLGRPGDLPLAEGASPPTPAKRRRAAPGAPVAPAGLRELEDQARTIIDATGDAFISMDADGRVLQWTLQAERMFGWPRSEAEGRLLRELIIPQRLRAAHTRGLRRHLASGEPGVLGRRLQTEALHRDGHEFPVELTVSSGMVAGRYVFRALVHDVSTRRASAAERQLLGAVMDSTGDAVLAKSATGIITAWNHAAERLYGYTEQEAVGSPLAMLIPPGRDGQEQWILERLARGESVTNLETERVRRDGSLVAVELTASPLHDEQRKLIGAIVLARDITERRNAEREALLARGLRAAFDRAPIGMALASPDGRFLHVNAVMCEITGRTDEELRAATFGDISHPEDVEAGTGALRRVLGGHANGYRMYRRFVRPDGAVVGTRVTVVAVRDEQGSPVYLSAHVERCEAPSNGSPFPVEILGSRTPAVRS